MDEGPVRQPARGSREELSGHIGRARDGDEASIARLVEELSPILVSWAQAHLRPASLPGAIVDPEDLVQEVWLKALPRISTLQPHPNAPSRLTPALLALLGTILRSRVTDLRRQAARRRVHGGMPLPSEEPPTASSGPFTKALRSERRRLVEDALATLSERERRIYIDRLLGGMSLAELAAEHGMSTDAMTKARQRVRVKLAKVLGPQLVDDLEPDSREGPPVG